MYLVYRPDGGEEQRWLYQPGKLRDHETEAIERRTGLAYGSEFVQELLKGLTRARRALLWTFLRRGHPTLRYEDVSFAHDELELQLDVEEVAAQRAQLEEIQFEDEMVRAAAFAMLDKQAAEAPPAPAPGKAPAPSGGAATPAP